jgi:23S rRNA G2445 N2-methylase RlmL
MKLIHAFDGWIGVDVRGAHDRVAADADRGGEADLAQLVHHLVGQRARLGHQPDRARARDVGRDDARIGLARADHARGELVLDPMCGIGTTLVEALHQDRRAVGVEYEARWAEIARTNINHTGPVRRGLGTVYTGDARHLDWILPRELHGQAALVVTSPPYGPSTHGRVTTDATGVHKRHHLYGDLLDRGNLANIGHHRLLAGFTRILTLTAPSFAPAAAS